MIKYKIFLENPCNKCGYLGILWLMVSEDDKIYTSMHLSSEFVYNSPEGSLSGLYSKAFCQMRSTSRRYSFTVP